MNYLKNECQIFDTHFFLKSLQLVDFYVEINICLWYNQKR